MNLDVWLEAHETRIGVLHRAEDRSLTFTYEPGLPIAARISLSLPVRAEPYTDAPCRGYFENLLFEGTQLSRILDSYQIDRGDTGALLYHLGADCPGAISITPEGTGPGKRPGLFPDDYEQVSEADLQAIVRSLHLENKLPDENRDPSPLAGMQGKIAIVYKDGQYWLPKPKTRAPTTHILKISPKADGDLTKQECTLLRAATVAGLTTTGFEAKTFALDNLTVNAILVDRFDREFRDNAIHRIHVEDLCQALGLAPSLKYERNSASPDHRFSAAAVGAVAKQASVPGLFLQRFLAQTLFNLLVGNTDNHAKNTSVLHQAESTNLAPLYDVVPVFMDNQVTHRFAFDIGAAQFVEDLNRDQLLAMMGHLGYARPRFDKRLESDLRNMAGAVGEISAANGGKRLADALASQMSVVADALNVDLNIPERDYFARAIRDEKPPTGGWLAGS